MWLLYLFLDGRFPRLIWHDVADLKKNFPAFPVNEVFPIFMYKVTDHGEARIMGGFTEDYVDENNVFFGQDIEEQALVLGTDALLRMGETGL
jgi:hypothetical protein